MNCLTLENEKILGAAYVISEIFLQKFTSSKAKTLHEK